MNQNLTEHDFMRTLPIIRAGTYHFFIEVFIEGE